MKWNVFLTLVLAPLLVWPGPLIAQDSHQTEANEAEKSPLKMRSEQVVALVNGEIEPNEIFTDGFLTAVPPSQLATFSQQLTSQFGAALSVEGVYPQNATHAGLHIRMERAIAKGGIAVDPNDGNKISELLFQEFEPVDDTSEKIEFDLNALPGEVSAYFGPLDGGDAFISIAPEKQMPLGSTFKLYVLAALAQDIAAGERAWDDVVRLDTKSFPSGVMQDWPLGAPVTLHTLASQMISISDNTATDQLIKLLGRDRMGQILDDSGHSDGTLNDPFLTTRELFQLKGGDKARLTTYSGARPDVRAQILAGLEDDPISVGQIEQAFSSGPVAINIEWFGNTRDLSNLFTFMSAYADDTTYNILAINPSVPRAVREKWAYIGYKGGSEPGVLNLTWLLIDEQGVAHLLVLSWSNPEASIEQTTLELIAQRILSLPR